ncbi:MAG TPA: PA2169 family four-helix-bundle protein [Candidatus Angelobacter sp.]|nr:PA2169 family four-helix-bundle protein [Candidatus Angelobacter sp.]
MADETLDLLKELIETCKDGETGYVHAAGVATDPQLKAYFTEQSLERARFGQELRTEAERLGDKPEASGSVSAVLHRVWFETKATIGLGDQSILNSVEQGEDRAKKDYEKALASQLPSDLRAIIQRQADSVLKAHDYVRDMRDGMAQPGEKVA